MCSEQTNNGNSIYSQKLFLSIPIWEDYIQSYFSVPAMRISFYLFSAFLCTLVVGQQNFLIGQQEEKLAEPLAIKKPKGAESKNIPDETPKNITNYVTAEEGRRRSKEETRQEISNAIAQSSRLLVALKTEVDMIIKNNVSDQELAKPSTYAMFLRKGLSRILGFKIALLKFLAIGKEKADPLPKEGDEEKKMSSKKIRKVGQTLSNPAAESKSKHNDEGKKLKKWLQPRNGTDSKCDVVILVKKCELEPKEECVVKQVEESCQNNPKICGKAFENQCKTVPRNVCKYVPVIKNCVP